TGTDAGNPFDPVLLDLHPGAATVALHAAAEVGVDPGGIDGKASGNAFDDGDERLAVRFAGGEETKSWHERKINPAPERGEGGGVSSAGDDGPLAAAIRRRGSGQRTKPLTIMAKGFAIVPASPPPDGGGISTKRKA